ncbi:serine-threonine/tyrosine-protein kinase catalytic domain-containing protein [Tanacetum coccineum]
MSIMKNWEGLKIPFEKIDVATEKFRTCIGRGGYGLVYKGVLSIDGKDTMVAVKRLNEHVSETQGLKRSLLDRESVALCCTTLTWLQRLKICADAARGLNHLHYHVGGHRMIIHRDIKSSNILIDENWVAKISDLGLSKLSATGFGMSLIVSNGCGTHGYCEPEYYTSGVVTKKSDVYSFGIVLFEVLCGRCLHDDREQRPSMDIVAKELEEALNVHLEENEEDIDENWEKRLPHGYPHLIEMSDIPLNYTTKKELYFLFRHGFLANNGQLWFSTCKSTPGICSILPATDVLREDQRHAIQTISLPESRFKEVEKLETNNVFIFRSRLESFMFSRDYNYACYLVFKLEDGDVLLNDLPIFEVNFLSDYKMDGNVITIRITLKTRKEESGSSNHNYMDWERSWVEKRDDGWLEIRVAKWNDEKKASSLGQWLWNNEIFEDVEKTGEMVGLAISENQELPYLMQEKPTTIDEYALFGSTGVAIMQGVETKHSTQKQLSPQMLPPNLQVSH